MIDSREFIRGEHFPYICDMRVGSEEKLPYLEQLEVPDKKYVSIYAKTENVSLAMEIIRDNPDKQFTLVTHNSDLPVSSHDSPPNLYRWFAQNRETFVHFVYSLPIGLENEHWFPYKQRVMLDTYRESVHVGQPPRITKAFAQFNPGTHPERAVALNTINRDVCDIYTGSNGHEGQHRLFCSNLLKYAFCLCPRGNGIDTHRVWEALYMGCIPICKPYIAHKFPKSLPILFVGNWSDVTEDLLLNAQKTVDLSLFDSDILKTSYWSKRINNEI